MAMVGYAAPCVLLANLIASLSGPSASLYLWSSTKPAPYMLAYRMRAPGSAALATIHALTTFFFAVAMSPRRNAAIPCSPLASRAIGEQGIAAFLLGDIATAKKKVVKAWMVAKAADPGARIRYASMYGAGLVELHKYNEALGPLNEAIKFAN